MSTSTEQKQMITHPATINNLLNQINGLNTIADSASLRQAMNESAQQATDDERETVRRALSNRLNELADAGEQALEDTDAFLQQNGIRYSLDEWLTVTNYARKYAVDTQLVSNWIRRGVVPANWVVELNALNNIRLVKDQPYR